MVRKYAPILLLILTLPNFCCSSGSMANSGNSSSTNSPSQSTAPENIAGQWSITATLPNSQAGGPSVDVEIDFTQAGSTVGTYDAQFASTNESCFSGTKLSVNGTLSGNSMQSTLLLTAADGSQSTISMSGTFGTSSGSGTFAGNCLNGWMWNATPDPEMSGSFAGTALVPGYINFQMSGTVSENTSFDISGAMTVTNSNCFSSLSLTGTATGDIVSLTGTDLNTGATLIMSGTLSQQKVFSFSYHVGGTPNSCSDVESGGSFSLTGS